MRILRTAVMALLLVTCAASGEDYQQREAELEELRARISQIQRDLQKDRAREDALQQQLADLDRKVGEAAAELQGLSARRQDVQARILELRRDMAHKERDLGKHRRYLAEQLRAAYASGQQEYLKLLLNQQDASQFQRVLVYYDYFTRARGDRIREAVDALRVLTQAQQDLDAELATLAELERRQQAERERLAASRRERTALLERIRGAISAKGSKLEGLRRDEQELATLLRELERALADIPEGALDRRPFREVKGQLPWPLEGGLAARFGQPRGIGDMRWSGLLIESAEGSEVKAVSHGRVVFSDWLRGFGLLLIIDHGDGYMSLYGHNQSLYKEAGDWVDAGETVAAVGASGGRDKPGLYFEIRAGGKPVNPQPWLRDLKRRG